MPKNQGSKIFSSHIENERRLEEACKEYVEDSSLHFYDNESNKSPEIAVLERNIF